MIISSIQYFSRAKKHEDMTQTRSEDLQKQMNGRTVVLDYNTVDDRKIKWSHVGSWIWRNYFQVQVSDVRIAFVRDRICWGARQDLNDGAKSVQIQEQQKLSIHYCADKETIETIFRIIVSANQLSLYGAIAEICEEYESLSREERCDPLWWDNQVPQLCWVRSRMKFLWIVMTQRIKIFYCNKMENELRSCHNKINLSKFFMDAGFLSVVEIGQYIMTKDTAEFSQFHAVVCREYTLPREEGASQPKGWIQGNTKIGDQDRSFFGLWWPNESKLSIAAIMKNELRRCHNKINWGKCCMDAGFLSVVEIGQFSMTKDIGDCDTPNQLQIQFVIDQGDLDNMKDGRKTSFSQEINVNSLHEELSSSDRTGRPVDTDVNQTRSSEDSKSLNVEHTHDRTGRLVTDTAAVQDDSQVYHEADTLNVDDEVLRKRMEADMDFRIPGLPHSVVKHAQSTSIRQLIQKNWEPPKSTCSSTRSTTESIILSFQSRIKTNDSWSWEHWIV